MTARLPLIPRALAVCAVAAVGLLVAGCAPAASVGGSGSGSGGGSEPSVAAPGPAAEPSAAASAEGFPTCDEVKAALGAPVADLVEPPDSENGVADSADGPALTCVWLTPETTSESLALEEYGGISLGVMRDPEYTEESMEPLGWNVDDPRVAAADAWALKVGGGYDPVEQLDPTGVQIVKDGVVVVLTSGGVALQDIPSLGALTNEWALGAGVAVLDLME
jgi:hypothetical protein